MEGTLVYDKRVCYYFKFDYACIFNINDGAVSLLFDIISSGYIFQTIPLSFHLWRYNKILH